VKKIILVSVLLVSLCAAVFASGASETGAAKDAWPKKTIQVIVPFNPGGDTDFNARAYATRLGEILGQNVVIVNMAGNGGATGATQVKNAAPDGYTVLFYHTALLVNELSGTTNFGIEAFEFAAVAAKNPGNVIAVSANSPYKTLKDLIEASKTASPQLTFAANMGATTYVQGTMLNKVGAKMNLVDFGGSSERIAALLGGHVTAIPNPLGPSIPYLESGEWRALALLEEERNPIYPNVPTAIEQGYDIANPIYYFFAFPKGTDQAIVNKFADALETINGEAAYQESIMKTYKQNPYFAKTADALKLMQEQVEEHQAIKHLL